MIKISAVIGAPDLEQNTLAVYSGDLKEAFKKVAGYGYAGVELMTKNPKTLDGKNSCAPAAKQLASIRFT